MINFRYHIVSITAVFLALAIGTALGSTFLDGATVDLLNRNIASAENRIDTAQEENEELTRRNLLAAARDDSLLADGSDRLVSSFLVDQPVMVIVAPGVDAEVASDVRRMLGASGADLRGTLTLLDPMAFDGDLDEDLAADLGVEAADQAELGTVVYERFTSALSAAGLPAEASDADEPDDGGVGDGQGDPVPPSGESDPDPTGEDEAETGADPTVPDGAQPDVLTQLAMHGYVGLERPAGDPGAPLLGSEDHRYVLVTSDEPSPAQRTVAERLLVRDPLAAPLPLVVVGPTAAPAPEGEPVEPDLIAGIRQDEVLRGRYSTVDDLDTFAGLVAMVFVLEDLHTTAPGHYGQGPGAQAVLPPPR